MPNTETPSVDVYPTTTCTLRPLREIARLDCSGRQGKPAHISMYLRLIKNGTALRDGSRLRAIRDSGGWLTSLEWLEEFRARLTADRLGEDADGTASPCVPPSPRPTVPGRRTARERQAAAERASRLLEAMGC